MLEIARERATAQGAQNAEFIQQDAEQLDLPARSVDAIVSRLGLMFLPNLPRALERFRSALRPGGWLAAAVPGPATKFPSARVPMSIIAQMSERAAPPAGGAGLFVLSGEGVLERALTDAGFRDVSRQTMEWHYRFASAAEFVRFRQDVPGGALWEQLATQPQERQRPIWRAIEDALQPYVGADGALDMPHEIIVVAARR